MALKQAPPVIVGAGLAGSAAAVLLARQGFAPRLLERTATVSPRICGEFVSVEAVQALAALGVDVLALGGRPTRRLRLSCGNLVVEAALPFEAMGLTRRTLDGALQQQAQAAGALLQRGQRVSVQHLGGDTHPFMLQLAGGERLSTQTLLLACGKTDLAPLARRPQRVPEALVGWQVHLQLAAQQANALEGHVEVMLFRQGYAGLQPVEGGLVNLCLLAQADSSTEHKAPSLQTLLQTLQQQCPLLAERLSGATWMGPAQTIYRVPYGHLHRSAPEDPAGLWRLGDQAVVIPSFTGDGMALALHTAALAAHEWARGGSAKNYHARLRSDVSAQVARASALYRLGRGPLGRGALLGLVRRWPALLGFIAAMTRVAPQRLLW